MPRTFSTFLALNPHAHAIGLWIAYLPHSRYLRTPLYLASLSQVSKDDDPIYTLRARLIEEAKEQIKRKRQRLDVKYGGPPFPEQMKLVGSIRLTLFRYRGSEEYVPAVFELKKMRIRHVIRAEMEKIIWGDILARTASAIEELDGRIDETIRTLKAEKKSQEKKLSDREGEELNEQRIPV